MGLINCPKCGETISDSAMSCPCCKFVFLKQNFIKCEDCGMEYETDLNACPKCGCPNSNIIEKTQKNIHKGVIISIIIIAIAIILTAVGILGFCVAQKEKEEKYYSNMETVSCSMLDGAAKAETAGNLIKSVWSNAIYGGIYGEADPETDKYTMKDGKYVDDFNDALSNLFADEDFMKSISEIKSNQSEVNALMKELRNPPKKYEEAYSVLKNYYDNYLKLTKSVINPNGSLNTFSEDFNKYDSDTCDAYEKMKLYLE